MNKATHRLLGLAAPAWLAIAIAGATGAGAVAQEAKPARHEAAAGESGAGDTAASRPDFVVSEDMKERFADRVRISGTTGAAIYAHACQACHMAHGEGAQGAGRYPALAGNVRAGAPLYVMDVVLNGLHGMPPFRGVLSDQQIADVVNYLVRDLNGHDATLTARDVRGARKPLDTSDSYNAL